MFGFFKKKKSKEFNWKPKYRVVQMYNGEYEVQHLEYNCCGYAGGYHSWRPVDGPRYKFQHEACKEKNRLIEVDILERKSKTVKRVVDC